MREETVKLLGKADKYFFSPEHPPLTEAAQRALDWAFDQKLKSGKLLLIGRYFIWFFISYMLEFHFIFYVLCFVSICYSLCYTHTQKGNT